MNLLFGGLLLAAVVVPQGGDYFSLLKILVMVILLPPWLYGSSWINKDSKYVHSNQLMWSSAALASGLVALLIWVLVPWYLLGLGVYLVLVFGLLLGYVSYRNKRVIPEGRVFTAEHIRNAFARKSTKTVDVLTKLKLYDNLKRPVVIPPLEELDNRRAYNLAQGFLYNVITFRSSDADITPTGAQAAVRFVIDGVVHNQPPADIQEAETLIDYVKSMSGISLGEKRRPQQGNISVEAGPVKVDVAIITSGTTHGQRLQVKVLQEAVRSNLEELGLPDDIRAKLEELNLTETGVLIISGPRRSGVTSTSYSLLKKHDAFTQQLTTLESPVVVELDNITQNSYKDQTELPNRLAQSMRRDPNVLLVDRCETPEAATLIIEAAEEKNLLVGITGESSFIALAKWVKMVENQKSDGMRVLKGILCQMLLRKLCPDCKEAYHPDKVVVAKLNLPADKIDKFYRPPTKPLVDEKGNPVTCATCQGLGYYGRTAAFELMEITEEIRQMVMSETPLARIKSACRKNKMLYLQEQALRKVMEGVTSVEEVIRVSKAKSQES